jgi:hypothetical protein
MTPVHLHLLITHLPIAGTFLGIPLLVLALLRRSDVGAAIAAALVLGLSAAGAVIAEESGEGAEHTAEGLPEEPGHVGVTETLIEDHEERAELAVPLAVVTALLAMGAAGARVWRPGTIATVAAGAALTATLASAGAMALVGQSGGRIRHTEVRPDTLTPAPTRDDHDD